jgi:hypothetical protein
MFQVYFELISNLRHPIKEIKVQIMTLLHFITSSRILNIYSVFSKIHFPHGTQLFFWHLIFLTSNNCIFGFT